MNRIDQVRTDLENDIAIQEAKLVDENKRFVKETTTTWEDALIGYHDNSQNRALEAAQAAVEIMISVYKTKVDGYKAQMVAYSSMADAYNSRIRAELGKAEFYKAQIEGKKMAVTAQAAMVNAYTAQVESVQTLADVYTTEMEAASIQANIDRIKMEVYSERVKAYRYEVEALAARYQVYIAQVEGEAAKIKMYQSLVEAYEAEVEGHVARARVLLASLNVEIQNIQAKAELYTAQVRKYVADTGYTVGLSEVRTLAQAADNTDYDARQRPEIARISARGRMANSSAQERAALETASASMAASRNKYLARIQEILARTRATFTKNAGRKNAAKIASHSRSTNISTTSSINSGSTYAATRSSANMRSDMLKEGEYHRTFHNS
jgi:hypothetical protein